MPTRVWLPIEFAPSLEKAGFSDFPDVQLESVIRHYSQISPELLSPEPLGHRQSFGWNLEEDLRTRRQPAKALDDFSILIEGLALGLLIPRTFDLHESGFRFSKDSDRYVTVLLLSRGPGFSLTVAGSFSQTTLVCPAANWPDREDLQRLVLERRGSIEGQAARSLIGTFRRQSTANDSALWALAIDWLLGKYPPAPLDPGAENQANIGPFLLQMQPQATPALTFFPAYARGRLGAVLHRLNGTRFVAGPGTIQIVENDIVIAEVLLSTTEAPKLFGLGNVAVKEVHELPVRTDFDRTAKANFLREFPSVYTAYATEISTGIPARFALPDLLRSVFHAMGDGAARAFLTEPGARWTYSDAVAAANLRQFPHQFQLPASVLYRRDGQDICFPLSLNGDRVAYYVEIWEGTYFGELSRIGRALWALFRARVQNLDPAREADKYFAFSGKLLDVRQNSSIPDPTINDAISWSNFLYWTAQQPDPLFRLSAELFAAQYTALNIAAKQRTGVAPVKVAGRDWLVGDAR